MRIGVDAHVLSGKYQGSRTYLLNLYQHVLQKQNQNEYYFFGHWHDERPYGKEVKYVNFKSGSRIKRLSYETHPLLVENKISWYHSTYISPFRMPCKTVVTIHDILFETHPQFFTKQEVWRNKLLVRRSAQKAVQIHTVSEYSKRAIIERYGVPEYKIHIIPNGVDLTRFSPENKREAKERILQKYGVENYILIVGRIEPRKNHVSLLKAYSRLKERNVDVGKLVVVGKPDFEYKQFFKTINELRLQENVHLIDSIDDQTLPDIYRAARLFVYPSFAEGFGIPPVEAMACGVPVITSNTTAIPESVGDAGILVDPHNIDQLAMAIEQVLGNPDIYNELVAKGEMMSKRWTWERSAQAYINATQNL